MTSLPASRIVGMAITAISIVLLAISIPMLMINPKFTAYGYEGGNVQIDQLVNLMIAGIIMLPFGLLFVLRHRMATRAGRQGF